MIMSKKSVSSITVRGKKPSSWANNTPPSKQNIDTVKIAIDIPIFKLLLCVILLIIVAIFVGIYL